LLNNPTTKHIKKGLEYKSIPNLLGSNTKIIAIYLLHFIS
jgi:hypothetical protein